ncbi:hypothetical protein BC939DRAFT_28874 [Gamsiella multidivaricata]|uniref:uncharacterized protein n=1 Tax=Gamsiella multidivaricata TaxID=101098 RepID=UPI00221FF449|nr:uncharacterized protein BC939DRAFT_28874 [Gamsiella multidivaricata]KAI7816877.1 hypothetical protein BC939DRAFT_28874 [Gamsiella multidivaricata]
MCSFLFFFCVRRSLPRCTKKSIPWSCARLQRSQTTKQPSNHITACNQAAKESTLPTSGSQSTILWHCSPSLTSTHVIPSSLRLGAFAENS